MRTVLFVEPSFSLGGVRTLVKKMGSALKMENLRVISWRSTDLIAPSIVLNYHLNDALRHVKRKNFYDVIIYFGSIVGLGCIIDKLRNVPVVVFISGHPIYELNKAMHNTTIPIRTRMGSVVNLSFNKLAYLANIADIWVCHTLTVCEEIGITRHGNYVLLKQFILPSEIAYYNNLVKSGKFIKSKDDERVQVFSYLSYADLPGLTLEMLVRIFNRVKKAATKPVRFIIEDPRRKGIAQVNDSIYVVGRMPWDTFLNTLATSDLYVETAIDEELRFTSLDAALLRVPIAKITASVFFDRQDYTEDEIIVAPSIQEFINVMTEYINSVDQLKPYYSRNIYNFVVNKRTWNAVKDHFMTALLSLIK